jgi:ketosteroid isomerase-like protein
MPSLAEDRDEIRDLFARYCLHIDAGAGAVDAWADLFTQDGVFGIGPEPLVGRAALVDFATNLAAGGGGLHHVVANEVIEVDGDVARSQASIVVLRGGQVSSSGRYVDVLRRVDGAWRIAERAFTRD